MSDDPLVREARQEARFLELSPESLLDRLADALEASQAAVLALRGRAAALEGIAKEMAEECADDLDHLPWMDAVECRYCNGRAKQGKPINNHAPTCPVARLHALEDKPDGR